VHEVDGPFGVEVGLHQVVAPEGGDEDDRRHLGLAALPYERGRLEAVHGGHPDVEQDDGEVLRQDATQCGQAGIGLDDGVPEGLQHRLQGQALGRVVVDHQDRHGFRPVRWRRRLGHAGQGAHATGRTVRSQGSSAMKSSMVSIGLGT
jgi:hypothetical protein